MLPICGILGNLSVYVVSLTSSSPLFADCFEQHIVDFIIRHEIRLRDPRLKIGLWRDPVTGGVYIDLSVLVPVCDEAMAFALKYGQRCICYLFTGEILPVVGTDRIPESAICATRQS
jgi:hypothetical protein